MSNLPVEVLITGRLVGGHPMDQRVVTDDKTNLPKMQQDGVTPRTEAYVAVAIAKGQEQQWNQTEWGLKIYNAGVRDWPAGEHGAATFAWKVTDGDSQVPNKKGKKPFEREGWAGHWIINASSGIPIKCYNAGQLDPTQQLQDQKAIKPGDYCRVLLNVKGNGPTQSPGVYLNPKLFEMSRAGVVIVLDSGPSAADAFGDSAAQLPPGAQVDTSIAAPIPGTTAPAPIAATPGTAPATPATDFTNVPVAPVTPVAPVAEVKRTDSAGNVFTEAQYRQAGFTEEQIAALPIAP